MKCLFAFSIVLLSGQFGESYQQIDGRIVGGSDGVAGQVPYSASLQDVGVDPPVHFCGAAVLDEFTFLTSASCIVNLVPGSGNLDVLVGAVNISEVTGREQRRKVVSATPHAAFNPINWVNDIGIFKINESLIFDEFVQPVTLPPNSDNTTGTCLFSGWGDKEYFGEPTEILQVLEMDIVPDVLCQDWNTVVHIIDGMLCAGGIPGEDSCTKDDGGPLYCGDYESGSGFLGGISSFGYFCAEGNPGVYTEVSKYLDWIEENR